MPSSLPVIISFPYSNARKPTALSGNVRAVDLQVGQDDDDITKRRRDTDDDEADGFAVVVAAAAATFSAAARPSHRSERWPTTCWHCPANPPATAMVANRSASSSPPSGDTYFLEGALVGGIVGAGAGLGAEAFAGDAVVVVALVVSLPSSSAFAFASSSAMIMGVDASIGVGGVRTSDGGWAATAAPAD